MARQADDGPASANPVDQAAGMPGSVNPAPGFAGTPSESQGPSFMGPFDKSAATAPLGMQGKLRFDWVMQSNPMRTQIGGHDWDSWIQLLPEDPNDMEYTRLLRGEKSNAATRERIRVETHGKGYPNAQGSTTELPNIGPPGEHGNFNTDGGDVVKFTEPAPGKGPSAASGADTALKSAAGVAMKGQVAGRQQDRVQKELDLRDTGEQQRKYREKIADKPIIMGLGVSETSALAGSPDNQSGAPDHLTSEWARNNQLSLDNEHAQRAARNGDWVYQGEVADPNGGPGYTRSVYVYKEDAKAQLAGMPTATIKAYQHELGVAETGVPSAGIKQVWDEAVQAATDTARSGRKVELMFLFRTLLAAYGAKAKKGAGGGGGSGPFGNESGADMVGANYYQAMMQILGDISGVK